jgi:hypothetical protein
MKSSTYKTGLKNLDLELKALLQADLKRFKEGKNKNNQANSQLLAA